MKLKEAQGDLTDNDFERVGEVWEKQDIYSKSSRRGRTAQIWIPRLVKMICILFVLNSIFFAYSYWHKSLKPSPLVLYQMADGSVFCAKPYNIDSKTGEKYYNFSESQKNLCHSLMRYEGK